MFGAWQAGVWSTLSASFLPDLIVGASVGALNGYAIASGWRPEELSEFWQRSDGVGFEQLQATARFLTSRPLQTDYAVVLVDLFRMSPVTNRNSDVTWRHLMASCAVPGVMLPIRIDGRWFLDGGLLNPLPIWAATELGATEIVAVNALPDIPSAILKPFVKGFRAVFGHNPPRPSEVSLTTLLPSERLGSLQDAIRWKHENAVRWLEQGREDAKNISIPKCLER